MILLILNATYSCTHLLIQLGGKTHPATKSCAFTILNQFRAVYAGFIILARRRFSREFSGLITRGELRRVGIEDSFNYPYFKASRVQLS